MTCTAKEWYNLLIIGAHMVVWAAVQYLYVKGEYITFEGKADLREDLTAVQINKICLSQSIWLAVCKAVHAYYAVAQTCSTRT